MVDSIDPWIALTIVRNIASGLMDRVQFLRQVQMAGAVAIGAFRAGSGLPPHPLGVNPNPLYFDKTKGSGA